MSEPITDKTSEYGGNDALDFGVSEMQGWRKNHEDAHTATILPGRITRAVFGVWDGHGGKEVALFCKNHYVDELQKLKEFKEENFPAALVRINHHIDNMLRLGVHGDELRSLTEKPKGSVQEMQSKIKDKMSSAEGNGAIKKDDAVELMMMMLELKKITTAENSAGASSSDGTPAPHPTDAGCTSVVAYVDGRHVYVANAGDSRAVLCVKGTAKPLSFDHKPTQEGELRRITDAGGTVNAQGRVNGNLNLSRCIGDLRYKVDAKLPPEAQIITAQPDIMHHLLSEDDEFMVLACDGIWDVKTSQEVCDFVRSRLDDFPLHKIAEQLMDACIAEDPKLTMGIGGDNMTAMIVRWKDGWCSGASFKK